jgi:hypothetical protein
MKLFTRSPSKRIGVTTHTINPRTAHVERLVVEIAELDRLCWTLPECDATGKLAASEDA